MTNLLLLDQDGTTRETISGKPFINEPDDQKIIDGVAAALSPYVTWTKIGITNQGGVGSGFKTLENAIAEQQRTLELLPVLDAILFCPDMDGKSCWVVEPESAQPYCVTMLGVDFRKPAPGMLHFARRLAWGWTGKIATNSIEECLYVGDREEDELAATAAGVSFMWADQWRSFAAMFCQEN